MKLRKKMTRGADIDLSPLIDMTFILLIFFMVSTTFAKDAVVDLQRPGAASAERAKTKALRVEVDRTGAIHLDGAPVKLWMLQSRARDAFRSGTSKSVLIISDQRLSVEKLVEVVDQLRLAGAVDVAVATHQELG